MNGQYNAVFSLRTFFNHELKYVYCSALQSKVEGLEEAVESETSLSELERKICEFENQKRQLLAQVSILT